jgi:isoquinoline 1-oxidoreductase alpha subunit
MSTLSLNVNGVEHRVEADPEMPLLWALRDLVGLTGTKFGCGQALCGACTVHLDGEAVLSCQTPVSAASGRKVTTIEGLSESGDHPLQRAWVELAVPQCGFCQPGQLMSAAALLAQNPSPTDADVDTALHANLCRCGVYQRIRAAVQRAAQLQAKGGR